MTHIAVIGVWHNAFVTAAGLAELGHRVTLVNSGSEPWTEFPTLGIHEPGLPDLLTSMRSAGRMYYANIGSMPDDVAHVGVVWLAIDTDLKEDGSPDVRSLVAALDPSRFTGAPLIVVGSQVPIGFCGNVENKIARPVAYVPENYRLGAALTVFRSPDRLVIGATLESTRKEVAELLSGIPVMPLLCDLPTAEMVKHATNAFLATSISLANELAKVGEAFGVDNQFVARALKADTRIGPRAYVRPGLGFAGGTLPRDLHALRKASRTKLSLVEAVLGVNDDVIRHIADVVAGTSFFNVCLLGYTYKPDTDTLRCSPSKQLAVALRDRCLRVVGYDPRMDCKTDTELLDSGFVGRDHERMWGEFAADVFVVVTPLPEFRLLSWGYWSHGLVYDLCDGADRKAVLAAGLAYKAIWQPEETL
jgi:UDPglucose 6-dehydrogenase